MMASATDDTSEIPNYLGVRVRVNHKLEEQDVVEEEPPELAVFELVDDDCPEFEFAAFITGVLYYGGLSAVADRCTDSKMDPKFFAKAIKANREVSYRRFRTTKPQVRTLSQSPTEVWKQWSELPEETRFLAKKCPTAKQFRSVVEIVYPELVLSFVLVAPEEFAAVKVDRSYQAIGPT